MSRSKDDGDEKRLEVVAKKLLAMPHKPREESKLGKSKGAAKPSPAPKKKPSR